MKPASHSEQHYNAILGELCLNSDEKDCFEEKVNDFFKGLNTMEPTTELMTGEKRIKLFEEIYEKRKKLKELLKKRDQFYGNQEQLTKTKEHYIYKFRTKINDILINI